MFENGLSCLVINSTNGFDKVIELEAIGSTFMKKSRLRRPSNILSLEEKKHVDNSSTAIDETSVNCHINEIIAKS